MQKEFRKKGKNPSNNREAVGSDLNRFLDFWGPIFFTFALYLGIRHFIAEARYIPSGSMLPGLRVQDRLLVEKLTYLRRSPRRGEIVVFNSPYSFDPVLSLSTGPSPSVIRCVFANLPFAAFVPGLGHSACDAYIKRVVAISGDLVVINPKGELLVNGEKANEFYVTNYCPLDVYGMSNCLPLSATVPVGHVIALGDNRRNSWDGRFWPGGPFLPEDQIIGRAVWRFWPLNRLGLLRF